VKQLLKIISPHAQSVEELSVELETDLVRGLDLAEAAHRLAEYGENKISTGKKESKIIMFLRQFHNPLVYILLAAVVVTLLMHEYLDAVVIFGVVLVNSIIGYIQEVKAVKALESLADTMETEAVVIREGHKIQEVSRKLVPGDVVFMQSGDKVPADIRLFKVNQLRIQEAALTGESLAVEKVADVLATEAVLGDRRNMVYASTYVAYGQGYGVVIYTGDRTEIGKISTLMQSTTSIETPLLKKIAEFSRVLVYVIGAMAILTFAIGIYRGEAWLEMMKAAIALAVGAIPEGLPAALTATLAIGVNRMAKRNAIIRKLPVVETLGSTTVICSDKTGTLTENQMTVRHLWTMHGSYDVSGQGYALAGEVRSQGKLLPSVDQAGDDALAQLLINGILCNDSSYTETDGQITVQGDPTEVSLYMSAAKLGLVSDKIQLDFKRLDELPFESDRQYMATLNALPEGGQRIYIKGAVERVLALCEGMLAPDGKRVELDRDLIMRQYEVMASQGLRVLTFAHRDSDAGTLGDLDGGFVLAGLQGMIDPPRTEAVVAVKTCQAAGVIVKMITGDHAITATAIARQMGILPELSVETIYTGEMLEKLTMEELRDVVTAHHVFARVTPEQKLRLVEALQSLGNVVAMTGDGVNDAPALKKADIGIAMGITGTEVAKDASDMVLADDNFASIEAAVEEGRGVFDNLVKFIAWTLPTNVGEGMVIMLAIFLGTTLPITPLQLLWINMTTAVSLGLMLAFEPKEVGIMQRLPRKANAKIIDNHLIVKISLVGFFLLLVAFGVFQWELSVGKGLAEARTAAVTAFVVIEAAYLFNCRSLTLPLWRIGLFSNPYIWMGLGIMTLLQAAFIYLPWMNIAFGTSPLDLDVWGKLAVAAAAVIALVEVEKWLARKFFNSSGVS
jgi:magnesium-transporting ATPase (P-type)